MTWVCKLCRRTFDTQEEADAHAIEELFGAHEVEPEEAG